MYITIMDLLLSNLVVHLSPGQLGEQGIPLQSPQGTPQRPPQVDRGGFPSQPHSEFWGVIGAYMTCS